MTVLITGGTGHVGGNLTRALLASGRRVRVLVRDDATAIDGLDVERVPGDVLDPASLDRAFTGAEVVYNLAAHISILPGEDPAVRVNVEGPRNIVAACLRHRVRRLVHFSSVHALAQTPMDQPVSEDRPGADDPGDLPYDRSKSGGEREIRAGIEQGLDAVIVNPSSIIGPHDYRPSRMGEVLLRLHDGTMPGLVRAGYDFVDVRDVVDGAIAAESKGKTGHRYILSGHWMSFPDLATLVADVTGTRPPRFTSPMWLARFGAPFLMTWSKLRGQQPLYTSSSLRILRGNSRFARSNSERDLGYTPRPMRDTVTDTFSWFREAGKLGSTK